MRDGEGLFFEGVGLWEKMALGRGKGRGGRRVVCEIIGGDFVSTAIWCSGGTEGVCFFINPVEPPQA